MGSNSDNVETCFLKPQMSDKNIKITMEFFWRFSAGNQINGDYWLFNFLSTKALLEPI